MTPPNIFSLATSELSQDAFITWLLQWAGPEYEMVNAQLHQAGIAFVQSLLAKHDPTCAGLQFKSVVAGRQRDHIDVWAEINDSIFLLIEDKVGSEEHSNQLDRYIKQASTYKNPQGKEFTTIVPVYFKTGNESRRTLEQNIHNRHFYSRGDFLSVLRQHDINNAIYSDFYAHLLRIEDETNDYLTLPPDQWHCLQIQGFYSRLEEEIKSSDCGWRYVANPNGGIWAMYWGWTCLTCLECEIEYDLYFQIEDARRLTIRGEKQDWETMGKILSDLQNYVKINNLPICISKAGRFRGGETAAIATITQPESKTFLSVDSDGKLDIDATIRFVHQVCTMMEERCSSH